MSDTSAAHKVGDGVSAVGPDRRRTMPRFHIEGQVALELAGTEERVIGRLLNLSWGGACLLVPHLPLQVGDDIVLNLPMPQAKTFLARAQVAWRQQINDQQTLVGVNFSSLPIRDHQKLERVLATLARPQGGTSFVVASAACLEICFLDHHEKDAFLEKIRTGAFHTCLFQPFQAGERLRLVVNGPDDLPKLLLRGRISWQKPFKYTNGPEVSGIFETQLTFDHPTEELQRTARTAHTAIQSPKTRDVGVSFPTE